MKISLLSRLLLLLLLLGSVAISQPAVPESRELIAKLRHKETPDPSKVQLLTCGGYAAERRVARELALRGPAALPEIRSNLISIEAQADQNGGVHWLLLALARIEGTNAYPDLRRILDEPRLAVLSNTADEAIALALGLTSYVSKNRRWGVLSDCGPSFQPREAMDQLILSTLQANDAELEASLGAATRVAFDRWRKQKHNIAKAKPGNPSVGYRIDTAGSWGDPPETLEGAVSIHAGDGPAYELPVFLKDAAGKDCGRASIRFTNQMTFPLRGGDIPKLSFLIDSPDIGYIVEMISSCASR
jgi:hypothetical protein